MKINVCEKCKKTFDAGYKTCPHCGSAKIKCLNVIEETKTNQKHCDYCDRDFDAGYTTCPYCGSRKVRSFNNEKDNIESKEESFKALNICQNCGNSYSISEEVCPKCGTKNDNNFSNDELYDSLKVRQEFKEKMEKRRKRNDFAKGLFIGSDSNYFTKEMLAKNKGFSDETQRGIRAGYDFKVFLGIGAIVLGFIVAIIIFLVEYSSKL